MGTTVTTNHGLIKPDDDEKIKEELPTFAGWAAQNTINMDKLDALFRATTHSTYTVNWTASTTNPTLGSGGFTEGKFLRLWPRLVIAYFRLNLGGLGALRGSGVYKINLPTTVDASLLTLDSESPTIGKAVFLDSSAVATSSVFLATLEVASSLVSFKASQGGGWTEASPILLDLNDRLSGYVMYPTSDA